MSFVHRQNKEVILKIVYFGAGDCGKTTSVQYVYSQSDPTARGVLQELSFSNERTLFCDFLPMGIGDIRGLNGRLHLYTIPGQTFYEASRYFIMRAVDGIIFVVDSREKRMQANIEAFSLLEKACENLGYDVTRMPLVFQYNRRDDVTALPVSELQATFNSMKRPYFETVAKDGKGVMETLQYLTKWVIRDIKGGEDQS